MCLPMRGVQETPASSVWSQLCSPQAVLGHCSIESSFPVQLTSSSSTRPTPEPKYAPTHARAVPLHTRKGKRESSEVSVYFRHVPQNKNREYQRHSSCVTDGAVKKLVLMKHSVMLNPL